MGNVKIFEEYHVFPPLDPLQEGPDIYDSRENAVKGNGGREKVVVIYKVITSYVLDSVYNTGSGDMLADKAQGVEKGEEPVFADVNQKGVYKVRR